MAILEAVFIPADVRGQQCDLNCRQQGAGQLLALVKPPVRSIDDQCSNERDDREREPVQHRIKKLKPFPARFVVRSKGLYADANQKPDAFQ